jgi:hypothetical protein
MQLTNVEKFVVSIFAFIIAVVWTTEWLHIAEDYPLIAWILLVVMIA